MSKISLIQSEYFKNSVIIQVLDLMLFVFFPPQKSHSSCVCLLLLLEEAPRNCKEW
jgi:hypothetical protein